MNKHRPRIIALLLAGGYGLRMHAARPKQFIETDGESILLYTMKAFERHPLVNELWVVCNPVWSGYVQRQASIGNIGKFCRTIPSGPTSHQSLLNGIHGLAQAGTAEDSVVMVHESVRPFVSHEVISSNILACLEHGNAITATHSHEAYLHTAPDGTAAGILPRESLMRAQTPVTFRLADLLAIARKAETMGIAESQSLVTLVHEIGWSPLHIVEGSMLNFKITLPLDVEIYNRLRSINYD